MLEGNPLQTPFDHLRREPYGDLAIVQFLHVDIGELDLTGASLVEVRNFIDEPLLHFLITFTYPIFLQIPPLLLRHTEKLTALNLNDNALKTLPNNFVELQNLRVLLLDNNLFR